MATWETVVKLIKEKKLKKGVFASEMEISRQTLDNWLKEETAPDQKDVKKMSKILEKYPDEVLGSVGEAKVVNMQTGAIPFYDAVATAGLAVYQEDQSPVVQPTETVNPGTWFRAATAAMRVYGDSMYPKYKSGCIIALKEIIDKDEIIYGEDYVVETSEQRVLKRILKSEKGEEYIEMNSINPQSDNRGKAIYASKDFHLNKVRRVFKVLGQIQYETGGDTLIQR
jgi:phage repressor protein C with HTH and peptisase S24 domain